MDRLLEGVLDGLPVELLLMVAEGVGEGVDVAVGDSVVMGVPVMVEEDVGLGVWLMVPDGVPLSDCDGVPVVLLVANMPTPTLLTVRCLQHSFLTYACSRLHP